MVPVTDKTSDDQPDYRVYAGRVELGAGWPRTSDRGNDYVSLALDDPSFAAPLCAALMPADEPDTHRLVWSRPSATATAAPLTTARPPFGGAPPFVLTLKLHVPCETAGLRPTSLPGPVLALRPA